MGVSGLLPVLRPITERVNVASFRGRRVGVDGFAWLHRGGYSCALELATGAPTSGYLTHFLHRVNLLLHHGVIPVVVFDGAPLPMKADTNAERRASRAEARRAGEAALAVGDRRAATEYFQRCVTVTPEMVATVMGALRPLGVRAMVAPYEADAQLAFLAATGEVDAVITEDSDLVVYGVPTLLFKMSKFGDADRVQSADLRDVPDPPMRHSTPDMLLWTAVLAGCDFFPGVPGLGVKRAHGLVRQFAGNLGRLLAFVSAEPRLRVQPTFIADFHRACLVFRHQVVWDPSARRTVHLTPLSPTALHHVPPTMVAAEDASMSPYAFLGAHPPSDVAAAVVRSELHPITHQPLVPRGTAAAPVVRPRSAWQPRGAGGAASAPFTARAEQVEVPVGAASGLQGGIRTFLVSKQSAAAVRKPFKRPRPAAAPSEAASDAGSAADSLGAAVTLIAQQVGALPSGTPGGSAAPSSAPPSGGRPHRVGRSPQMADFLSLTRADGVAAGAGFGRGDARANSRVGDVEVGGAAGRRRSGKVVVSSYFGSPLGGAAAVRRTSLNNMAVPEAEATVPSQQGPAPALLGRSLRRASPPPVSPRPASPCPASPRFASSRSASPRQTRRQPASGPLSRSPFAWSNVQVEQAESRAWSLPPRPKSPLPRRLLWEEKGHALFQLSRGSSSVDGGALDWDEAAEAEADAALAETDADMARAGASPSGSPSKDDCVDEHGMGADGPGAEADLFPLLAETAVQEEITSTAIEAAAAADVAARFGRHAGSSRAALLSSSIGPLPQAPVMNDESSAEAEEGSRPSSPELDMDDASRPKTGACAAAAVVRRRSSALPSFAPSGLHEQQLCAPRSLRRPQLAEHRPFRSQLVRDADVRVNLPLPRATNGVSPVTPVDMLSRIDVLRCSRAASAGGSESVERRRRRPLSPSPLVAGSTGTQVPPGGSGSAFAGAPRSLVLGDPGCTPVSPVMPTPSAPQQRPTEAAERSARVASVLTPSGVDCGSPADRVLPPPDGGRSSPALSASGLPLTDGGPLTADCEQERCKSAQGHVGWTMTVDNGAATADNKLLAAGDGPLSPASDVAVALLGGTPSGVPAIAPGPDAELPPASSEPEKVCLTTAVKQPPSSGGQLPSASADVSGALGVSGACAPCPSVDVVRSGSAALLQKPASVAVDAGPSGGARLSHADAVLAQASELTLGLAATAERPPRSPVDADGPPSATDGAQLACTPPVQPLVRASPLPSAPPASPWVGQVASPPPPATSASRAASQPWGVAPGSSVAVASCTPPTGTPPSPVAAGGAEDADDLPQSRPALPVVASTGDFPMGGDSAGVPAAAGTTAVLLPGGSPPRGAGSQPSVASVVLSTVPDGSEPLKSVTPSLDSGVLLPTLAPTSSCAPGSAMSPDP